MHANSLTLVYLLCCFVCAVDLCLALHARYSTPRPQSIAVSGSWFACVCVCVCVCCAVLLISVLHGAGFNLRGATFPSFSFGDGIRVFIVKLSPDSV